MSTFQGFKIKGIDCSRLPLPVGNQPPQYTRFYLLLEPMGAYANPEIQALWGYSFSVVVETWNNTGQSLPRLEFVPVEDHYGEIYASDTELQFIQHYIPEIKRMVVEANQKTLQLINERNYIRSEIALINSESFRN